MTVPLKVDDIASYLTATGWEQDPRGWHGGWIWRHPGDYEVLVPARNGMGDGNRRLREILLCLSTVEKRPAEDIAREIARPHVDTSFFRTFPANHDSGYTSLPAGVQAVQGVRNLLSTAARTVLQGPHFAFAGRPPAAVGQVLRAAELGPARDGSYVVEIRLTTEMAVRGPGGEVIGGRAVLAQMIEAIQAAHTAVMADDLIAFDEAVTAGVSADLCKALSDLSGSGRKEAFEVTFRWARSQPLDAPSHAVAFQDGSGLLLEAAAGRLRELNASGPATVTGVVEGLHDDPGGDDRWRIRIRGELRTEHILRSRRTVWVRLADQAAYDRAFTAHREQRVITVTGHFSSTTGRVELVPRRELEL